jgi:hypothetical protein
MSIVGPRPERPEIIARNGLLERVPGFSQRTKVLPGVTGLAQINLPPDVDAESVIPKVQLDLEYIRTANIGLELRILVCTALRMLGVRHGHAVEFLRLGRPTSISAGAHNGAMHACHGHLRRSDAHPRSTGAPVAAIGTSIVNGHHPALAFSSAAQAINANLNDDEESGDSRLSIESRRHKPR